MVLSREDLMSKISDRIGEDNSDEALAFIEDVTDTLNDFESRVSGSSEAEWQQKYDELDASWRNKYKERFFKTDESEVKEEPETKDEPNEVTDLTIDDLFIESEV